MIQRKIGEEQQKNQKEGEAVRYDYMKLRWDLMPDDALEKIVEIYTHGAIKYSDENWRNGFSWKRCIGSLKRHLKAFTTGEDIDEDSGALHLSQIAWNAITLLWFQLYDKGTDDRVITFDNPELMIQCKEDIQKQIDMFWKICEEKMNEKKEKDEEQYMEELTEELFPDSSRHFLANRLSKRAIIAPQPPTGRVLKESEYKKKKTKANIIFNKEDSEF